MTVFIRKPETDIREKINELDKSSGVAGEAMLRAETPEEQFNLINAGRKNFIINGAMEVWQRGTSFTNIGGGGVAGYNADRWNATRYASSDNDITREDASNLDGFRYCARSARSGGDTTNTARFFHQVLETVDTWKLVGNFVTFSFYARAGAGLNGGQINSTVRYHTEVGKEERMYYNNFMTATGQVGQNGYHSDIRDDSWTRFTNTMYIPSNAQQVSVCIYTEQSLPTAVSADYFEVTGCQLEIGKIATPFEQRSYGEELALCQRYFEKAVNIEVDPDTTGSNVAYTMIGAAFTTTAVRTQVEFKVTKRADPAITRVPSSGLGSTANTWGWYNGNWNAGATSMGQVNTNGFSVDITVSGATRYQAYLIDGNWFADSEL